MEISKILVRMLRIFVVLLIATFGCLMLVIYLQHKTKSNIYNFLYWDIFLAWIPVILSVVIITLTKIEKRLLRRFLLSLSGIAWLFFLPNASYLVTEMLHAFRFYKPIPNTRFWFELEFWYILLTAFTAAVIGLFLYSLSLYLIQFVIRRYCRELTTWLLIFIILLTTSLGVYIGRFIRWNSWDVLLKPNLIIHDLFSLFTDVDKISHLLPFMGLVFGIVSIFYLVIYLLINNKETIE